MELVAVDYLDMVHPFGELLLVARTETRSHKEDRISFLGFLAPISARKQVPGAPLLKACTKSSCPRQSCL